MIKEQLLDLQKNFCSVAGVMQSTERPAFKVISPFFVYGLLKSSIWHSSPKFWSYPFHSLFVPKPYHGLYSSTLWHCLWSCDISHLSFWLYQIHHIWVWLLSTLGILEDSAAAHTCWGLDWYWDFSCGLGVWRRNILSQTSVWQSQ